jgi:hypothetical protein
MASCLNYKKGNVWENLQDDEKFGGRVWGERGCFIITVCGKESL